MLISDLLNELQCYENRKGFFRRLFLDHALVAAVLAFTYSLLSQQEKEEDRSLSAEECTQLENILNKHVTYPGHASHRLKANLSEQLRSYEMKDIVKLEDTSQVIFSTYSPRFSYASGRQQSLLAKLDKLAEHIGSFISRTVGL